MCPRGRESILNQDSRRHAGEEDRPDEASRAKTGYVFWSVIVIATYVIAGWLSRLVPGPSDMVTPLFLPAGVALAASLVAGRRAFPAIYLAAALFSASVYLPVHGLTPAWLAWSLLLQPLFMVAMAHVGRRLAESFLRWPQALDSASSIAVFIGLVIPASSLVSALPSAAVTTLIDSDPSWIMPSDVLLWWQSHLLGCILLVPLLLGFWGRPADIWRPRRTIIAVPMLAALVLAFLVFRQVDGIMASYRESGFHRDMESLGHQIERRLDAQMETLLALGSFVSLKNDLDRRRFRAFVEPMLERYPDSQNYSFNPRVTRDEREAFEARVRAGGLTDFRILGRDERQVTHPADERPVYYPILYVVPMAGNREVVGLDPLSIPAPARAIHQSIATGRPVASDAFTLTQEPGNQRGVVVYYAVYAHPASERTSEQPLGLVTSAFRMGDVVQATVSDARAQNVELCLLDRGGAPGNRRLVGPEGCDEPEWTDDTLAGRRNIDFAGRNWQLQVRAMPEFGPVDQATPVWFVGLGGSFLTGLLGAFLLLVSGQTRRISALVDLRTRELANATERLHEQRQALSRAQGVARLGSWESGPDADETGLDVSNELGALLGKDPATVDSEQALLEAFSPLDRQGLSRDLARARREPGQWERDCRVAEDEDRVLHVIVESEWRDGDGIRVRGIAQDVTEARAAARQIETLAHYDGLTGLANRTLWLDTARRSIKSAERHGDELAILFLDLDQFKTINDSLGHETGDRLLAVIAGRLEASVRREDVLARLGGDEFVLLLPRLERADDASRVAEKLLDTISEAIWINHRELKVSGSIGIATFPADGNTVETLLQHADTAMYRAKEAGRHTYAHFTPAMNEAARERLFIESGIRQGLSRGEFVLHFQPQLDRNENRIVGVEALVRWMHPTEGMLMPGRFIPAAERGGLILSLGDWILEQACRQQAQWQKAGLGHLRIAVNISALQFRRKGFSRMVGEIVQQTGADPERIKLEITESALMEIDEDVLNELNQLRDLGLTLSLDDFGTGYSSLSYLKQLPITEIKLDRAFIKDLPQEASIAETAILMARNLGMAVIAEGVETEAQAAWLMEHGCHLMQGFLFARPTEADALDLESVD